MEALVLAAALRVIGPAVQYIDAELEQPDAEPVQRWPEDRPRACHCRRRMPPAGRSGEMSAPGGFAPFRPAGWRKRRGTDRIARMIVDDGQRMAAVAVGKRDPALEVHLPQQVRRRLLKALVSCGPPAGGATIRPCRHRISWTVEIAGGRCPRARDSARSCARPRPDALAHRQDLRSSIARSVCAAGSHADAASDRRAPRRPAQRPSHLYPVSGWIPNRRHSSRRFAPSCSASRQTHDADPSPTPRAKAWTASLSRIHALYDVSVMSPNTRQGCPRARQKPGHDELRFIAPRKGFKGHKSRVRRSMASSQTLSRSASNTSFKSSGAVYQAFCAISPSSWPGAQPA